MWRNEVIDMHCIMQNLKNAQVFIYYLADLNISHCVELTFFPRQAVWIFCGKAKSIYKIEKIII